MAYKTEVGDKEFTCRVCGGCVLEEIMVCVTQISTIKATGIAEGQLMADAEYFDTTSESGDLERIQCGGCGMVVADDYEELLELAKTDQRFTPTKNDVVSKAADLLDTILNVPFTFSVNCRSGFVPNLIERCECWRCRDKRHEPHDEVLAATVAAEADRKWDLVKDDWMKSYWTMANLKEKYGDAFYDEESTFFARGQKHLPVTVLAKEWVNNTLIVVWKYKEDNHAV